MMGIAVIGLGHWGPNYVRVFNAVGGSRVVVGVDPDARCCDRLKAGYPQMDFVPDYRQALERPDVDAVVVAVPSGLHHQVVSDALAAGKHVLCEKPLTTSSGDAWDLVAKAKQANRVLMVGHIFLFNPGIDYLAHAVSSRALGAVYYISSVRTNMGPFRHDVNAAWDLASHDIYIFNHILECRPVAVSALGGSYLRAGVEDIVFMTLQYPGGIMGHVHISWLDPKKVRQITLVGEMKMVTWDENGTPGPVMVYDRSVVRDKRYESFGEFQLLAREGDVNVPRIPSKEPLPDQAREFLKRCAAGDGQTTRASGADGAVVVDVLTAASKSLTERGRLIEVDYGK